MRFLTMTIFSLFIFGCEFQVGRGLDIGVDPTRASDAGDALVGDRNSAGVPMVSLEQLSGG